MSTLSPDEMAWTDEQARHSPKVLSRSVRTMSARNRDEAGGDSSYVRCVLSDTLISDHYKRNIPEKTSASVKHILPYAERHRHTVL